MPDTDTILSADWFSEKSATFGDRVSGAREAVGLSQKELAAHLGRQRQNPAGLGK